MRRLILTLSLLLFAALTPTARPQSQSGSEPLTPLWETAAPDAVGLAFAPDGGAVATVDSNGKVQCFDALRSLRGELEQRFHFKLPHLSMGMSGDFAVAVEEGATLVRIGTRIFGPR